MHSTLPSIGEVQGRRILKRRVGPLDHVSWKRSQHHCSSGYVQQIPWIHTIIVAPEDDRPYVGSLAGVAVTQCGQARHGVALVSWKNSWGSTMAPHKLRSLLIRLDHLKSGGYIMLYQPDCAWWDVMKPIRKPVFFNTWLSPFNHIEPSNVATDLGKKSPFDAECTASMNLWLGSPLLDHLSALTMCSKSFTDKHTQFIPILVYECMYMISYPNRT